MIRFTTILALLLSFCLYGSVISREIDDNYIKDKLPQMLGANNVGKEFWFTIPPCYEETGGKNFIKLFITAPTKTQVVVEVPGKGFYATKSTIPNDVIEFNITPVVGQPYTKRPTDPEVPDQIWRGAGLHVYAKDPLVVYCVVRYLYTSDGFLALPVSSLGREYICAGYPCDPMFYAVWRMPLPDITGITAAYDNTTVRFTLGGNTQTKTAGGLRPGQSTQVTLNKGDVFMVSGKGDMSDLTGSKIIASKPVSVVTGNQCTNIPVGNQWCDYTVEMDIPTFTWGLDLHVPKVPNRKYTPIIRIFAKEPNTKFYRDNRQIGVLPEGGGMEGRGFIEMRIWPFDVKPIRSAVFSGDKPISVTLYNTGVQEDGFPTPNSDPFTMAMTPMQQYQKEITFCTPGIMGSQGFNENYVHLVYQTDQNGFMPDDVEFAEVLGGQFTWKKLRDKFGGLDEIFNYDVNGKKYALKTITLPHDGVYKIRAKNPFAAYSFGYSPYDSYGFPTSAALADLERPDTVPPWPKWTLKCDGTVDDGVVTEMPNEDSIRSNLSMIVFHSELSNNYEFTYKDFIAGETRTTTWTLNVIDKTIDAKAVISFIDRKGNDSTITIEYHATKLAIRPKYTDYGLFKVGQTATHDFWLINESDQSSVTVTQLNLKTDVEFKLDLLGKTLPLIVPKMDSIPFKVIFTAGPGSIFTDSIGVGDTCIFAYKAKVKAAIENPYIHVTDIDFGKVTVGLNKTMDFQLTNKGSVPLVVSGYSGPNLSVYTHNIGTIDNGANKLTVKPGEVKVYQVTFQPTAEITYPDTIWFQNDAPNNGTEEKNYCLIIGQGIAPGLTANDYDWGRKRIDHSRIPKPRYPATDQVILLSNPKTQDVYITDYQIINSVNGEAFEFDSTVIKSGLTIKPGEFVYIPVFFHPTKVGYHEFSIKYLNDANLNVTTTLKGIGIMPRLQTQDYNFDTTIVRGTVGPKNKNNVIIRNLSYMQDTIMVGDTVRITNLIDAPGGAISTDGTTYGSEGFMYNIISLNLPIRLAPGESLTIPAEFQAQHIGAAAGNITTASDAEAEVTSNWTGYGISEFIRSFGATTAVCYQSKGGTDELTCKVENYGSGPITVKTMRIDPPLAALTFKTTGTNVDNTSYLLDGSVIRDIVLLYNPLTTPSNETYRLIIENTASSRPLDTAIINVSSGHSKLDFRLSVLKPDNAPRDWPFIGRDAINCNIKFSMDNNADITYAKISSLNIEVKWNGKFLKVDRNSIQPGSNAGGLRVQNVVINDTAKSMIITLGGSLPVNSANVGEILKFKFGTYLPTADLTLDKTNINLKVTPVGIGQNESKCIEYGSNGDSINVTQTCAYTLRKNLLISGRTNALNDIAPNPVGAEGALISFSVGLDGWTSISIYNSTGELVSMPLAMAMKPGEYEFNLPVNDMPSGKYYIIMNCGDFTQTKELIISK